MTALAYRNDPKYDEHDSSYDEAKARFIVRRAEELLKTEMTYAEALCQAEKEWEG